MAIQFNIAPTITSGSKPLASHMSGLAEALNSRLRSGLADCTKRIHQYVFNNFRQLRNPDVDGNYPSLGEFSMFYQGVTPDIGTYPVDGKGENEGANLANPANQFVFGIGDPDNGGTLGEGDSLTTYDFFKPTTGNSPSDYWQLAKQQRGAYDNTNGNQYAPMFDLSQRHFRLHFPDWSRHHKTPGGYLPIPEKSNIDCVKTAPAGSGVSKQYWSSYLYKFRNITTGVIEYTGTGTCGPDGGGSDTDIAYIADYPFAWYVYQFDGNVYRFDKSDYLMANDGGGSPGRENGDQIQRLMINPFLQEFRGTEQQRTTKCFFNPSIDYSFANEDFYKSQYQLAPQYAVTIGDELDAVYTNFNFVGNQVSGSTSSTYAIHSGYRIGGHLISQQYLDSDPIVQLLNDSIVISEFTCSRHSGSKIVIFQNGPNSGSVSYRFKTSASFSNSSGYIQFEQSELLDYRPEVWDGYALIRMASAQGAIGDNLDTTGTNCDYAKSISDNYFNYGCLVGMNNQVSVEQQQASVNTNPVFDASRRYVNSFSRTINGTDMQLTSRALLTGYEVSASKSILYFNRYQSATGLFSNNIDLFDGMINTSNSASNGIVTSAPIQGYTNEWLMELCGKPYHPSDSSIWKTSVYANYFPYINRCHILPGYRECDNGTNPELFRFFQDNIDYSSNDQRLKLYFPESLTAYNYDGKGGALLNKKIYDDPSDPNGIIAESFYKSCQIYPKPYEIESITCIAGDIVKIVFTTRFQHGASAPVSISNNVSSWVFADVESEEYRTDENIVRLFLLKMYNDSNNPTATIGDCSVNSSLPTDPDNPYGSIYPTFFFTKLIPKPYANDGVQSTGSLDISGSLPRAYDIQLCETYVRAICEGFVDNATSVEDACASGTQADYDYTFANLCYNSFGKQWISNLSGSLRPDYPQTYGPFPTMRLNAEVFNQLASCINNLVKVRLPLPYKVLGRVKEYTGTGTVTPSWGTSICDSNFARGIALSYSPPSAGSLTYTGDWFDTGRGFTALTYLQASCGAAGEWNITNTKQTIELAFEAQDPLSWNACNDDLRQLVSGSVSSAAVYTRDVLTRYGVSMQLTNDANQCSDDTTFWKDGSQYWNNITPNGVATSQCAYHTGSVQIDAGNLSTTDLRIGYKWNPVIGLETCNDLPYNRRDISVVNTRHLIIVVPTV